MGISVFLLSAFVLFFLSLPVFKLILRKSSKLQGANPLPKTLIFLLFLFVLTFLLSFPLESLVNFIYNEFILK